MHIYNKLFDKIRDKTSDKYLITRQPPNVGDLVSYTKPLVDTIGRNTRPVFKPKSGLFDGVGDFVPLPETVTLVGDLRVESTLTASVQGCFVLSGGEGVGGLEIYLDRNGTPGSYTYHISVFIAGSKVITTQLMWYLDVPLTVVTRRVDGVIYVDVDGVEDINTFSTSINLNVENISARGGTSFFLEGITCSIKATDSTGVKFDYSHPTQIDASTAVWFDRGPNKLHATATVSDVAAHCDEDSLLQTGSDNLNLEGVTISDGVSYFINDNGTGLIPSGVAIPSLLDGSGCCAYLSNGATAPLVYPGRAKYSPEIVNGVCGSFDGTTGDYLEFTGLAGTETVVSSIGTSTPSVVSAGRIDFTAGTSSIIVLSNGWTIVLEEYVRGSAVYPTTVYGYKADGTYVTGTVHATDIAALWSGTKDGENHKYSNGYTLSAGIHIPANPYTPGLDVLGNALTVQPRRLTGQEWKWVLAKQLMDAELNMTLDGGGDNSAHTEEFIYDSLGAAKTVSLETEADGNVNNSILVGPKGTGVYSERQTDSVANKMLKEVT